METPEKEFKKEFQKIESCDNLVINCILTDKGFGGGLIANSNYTTPSRENYRNTYLKQKQDKTIGELVGYWKGVEILEAEEIDRYEIIYEKTYEICKCCFNEKFYNENKNEWYCPSCLEHRPWHYRLTQWKRKAITYLPERVKQ
jgi:hypothetical protein